MPDRSGSQAAVEHEKTAPDLGHGAGVAHPGGRQIGIGQAGEALHQAHGLSQTPAKQAE
ncbi:hypothetical protein D3C80_2240110 [compost metagenome]